MDQPEGFNKAQLKPMFKRGQALIWRRTEAGFQTNVRWTVRHHSPDGLEIGYPGSGPADLALNAMAALFPVKGGASERCYDGQVSRRAWLLHQDFKFEFLAAADRQEGVIEWERIEQWLAAAAAAAAAASDNEK